MKLVVSLAVLAFAGLAPQTHAQDVAFEPDGQWRLTTLEDGCSVARDFVRGEEKVTFSIKRIHPGAAVQFAVIGAPVLKGSASLQAAFLPSDSIPRFDKVAYASIGERDGVVFAGPLLPKQSDGTYPSASDTTQFVVIDPRKKQTTLNTRAIDQAITALDDCVVAKLLEFDVDMESRERVTELARPINMEDWASKISEYYPAEALRNNRIGTVAMRLIIDEQGRVKYCHVGDFLAAKVLRDAACDGMIEHGRYEPARDGTGKPITDFVMQSVRYTIGRGSMGYPSADAHGFRIPN